MTTEWGTSQSSNGNNVPSESAPVTTTTSGAATTNTSNSFSAADASFQASNKTLAERWTEFNYSIKKSQAQVEQKKQAPLFLVKNGLLVDSYVSPKKEEDTKKEQRVQQNVIRESVIREAITREANNNLTVDLEQEQGTGNDTPPEPPAASQSLFPSNYNHPPAAASPVPVRNTGPLASDPPPSGTSVSGTASPNHPTSNNNNHNNNNRRRPPSPTAEAKAKAWAIYFDTQAKATAAGLSSDDDDSSSSEEEDDYAKFRLARETMADRFAADAGGFPMAVGPNHNNNNHNNHNNHNNNMLQEPQSTLSRYEDSPPARGRSATRESDPKKSSKPTKKTKTKNKKKKRTSSLTRKPNRKSGGSSATHNNTKTNQATRSRSCPPKPDNDRGGRKRVSFFDTLSYYFYDATCEPNKNKNNKKKDKTPASSTKKSSTDETSKDSNKSTKQAGSTKQPTKDKSSSSAPSNNNNKKTKSDTSLSDDKTKKQTKPPPPPPPSAGSKPEKSNASKPVSSDKKTASTKAPPSPQPSKERAAKPPPSSPKAAKPPPAPPSRSPGSSKSMLGDDLDREDFEDEFGLDAQNVNRRDEEMGSLLSSTKPEQARPNMLADPSLRAILDQADRDMKGAQAKMKKREQTSSKFVRIYPIAVPILMVIAFLFGCFIYPFM